MEQSGEIYGKTDYQFTSICLDNMRYGCYADYYLSGTDFCGTIDDIISYDINPNCCKTEHIRCAESLKQSINTIFLQHVAITKKAFKSNREVLGMLGFNKLININLSRWIDRLKFFYLALLSNSGIFEKIKVYGITVEEIEMALKNLLRLDENHRKITGFGLNLRK